MTGSTLTALIAKPAIFQTSCSSYLGIRLSFVYCPIIRSSFFRDFFIQKYLTNRHFNSRCCYEGHFPIQCH